MTEVEMNEPGPEGEATNTAFNDQVADLFAERERLKEEEREREAQRVLAQIEENNAVADETPENPPVPTDEERLEIFLRESAVILDKPDPNDIDNDDPLPPEHAQYL